MISEGREGRQPNETDEEKGIAVVEVSVRSRLTVATERFAHRGGGRSGTETSIAVHVESS